MYNLRFVILESEIVANQGCIFEYNLINNEEHEIRFS